jgi:Protein of unknown function (DUF2905)
LPKATGRTGYDEGFTMGLRWLLVLLIALLLFSFLHKWLEKIGLGKLPGDFRFRLFGREFFIPLASSVALSLVAMGISKLF